VRAWLRNEFAHVCVEVDETANGARLRLTDVRTNKVFHLDPLELECLAWCAHSDLRDILDPSRTRWSDDADESGEERR
jgi:hypothetical protein